MVRINVDLRFAIIGMESVTARRHAEIAARRLESLPEEIRRDVLQRLEASIYADDEVERSTAFQEMSLLEEELPRFEAYGALFVLFAVFESVVKRLPRYVLAAGPDSIAHHKGDGFIAKASRW